ncbi:MAG TPA: two-component regulator propeller domain-containing protein, partial [Flavobacterium sp.]|nr:two-component regulator propeller domain-containing protein [Flavobacterium sp.]
MKIFSISFFFLIGCLGISESGKAQQQQIYFDKYDVKSGLPESFVRDMVEDPKGYIWMATQNGLVRYDGYRYKVYQLGSKKTNLDPITNVSDLYKDKNNVIWVSTSSNGLFKYNRSSDTFIQFAYPEKDLAIGYYIFADDKAGNLWGTADKDNEENYIWKLDKKGHFEFFGKKFKKGNYVNASRIYSVFTSKAGKVWFGSNNGFYSYEGKNIPLKGYSTSTNPEQTKEVVYLYEPPSEPDVFWMVTFRQKFKDCKIVRFDSKSNTFKEFNSNPEYFNYTSANVYDISSSKRKFYNSIYEDKKKQLWFACYDGLVQLNRNSEKINYYKTGFKYEKTSDTEWFWGIKETKEDNFWLSSPSGLVYFDSQKSQFERYQPDPEHPGSVNAKYNVASKMIDRTGAFWVGFGWAGANKSNRIKSAFNIYKHNPKQSDSYPKDEGIFALGKKGYKWFSGEHAIYKWKEGTNSFEKKYSADPEEPFISQGCLTKDGNFYISTLKSLVFYNLKTGKKEKYAFDKIIPEGFLFSPFETEDGIIWLSTYDKGICSFNPKTKKFKAYSYRENQEKITAKNKGALDDSRVTSTYV